MDTFPEELARRFAGDMARGIAELARLGYDAKVFQGMVADHGAVDAARRLVLDPRPSYGLWRLKELRRLDSSVEMWVLLPWYEPLFADVVREAAERKLRLLDVDVAAELARLVTRLSPA
ncbi:hypothetical protein [Saccharothrix longispora]|uniref:hypothetical protein n=1 Tax=Saccharothrix longispora TaxID=33920 RepID=UPI0028FD3064|nr:hypothetical protein [Saccharothrix longispora]MBY8850519.1 hypothetical protein [Saccharothrix sp. MB29]MDU0289290.1 hypothetical protein [Saccharothrix longispora]